MSAFLSFIGTIFLILFFFGVITVLFVIFFVHSKFMELKRMAMGGQANDNVNSNYNRHQSATTRHPNANQQPRKIFQQDEGEYVDFEEIKEQKL